MATPISPRKPRKTANPSERRPPPIFVTRAAIFGSTFAITFSAHSASTNTRTPKMRAGMATSVATTIFAHRLSAWTTTPGALEHHLRHTRRPHAAVRQADVRNRHRTGSTHRGTNARSHGTHFRRLDRHLPGT